MSDLVLFLLIFLVAGAGLLAANLFLGWLVRPHRPSPEKAEVYECGEQPIGSAWVQFDLRFYVVALLFVIFDVELAFFFPWAVVFGTANRMADPNLPEADRAALSGQLLPGGAPNPPKAAAIDPFQHVDVKVDLTDNPQARAAKKLAWVAFADILVFFGVLLVGFAYLWRRGDLDWVRSTAAQPHQASPGNTGPPAAETIHGIA
jgi:NADH-quinone oxidoreductase subunit A